VSRPISSGDQVNGRLSVADITTYLEHTGWRRRPEPWRGAAVWTWQDAYEALVPARDGMGDGDIRVSELVDLLATVEKRPAKEITQDINSPHADQHWYRTFAPGLPSGFTTLQAGLDALRGVTMLLDSSARAVVDGPHFAFSGEAPTVVGALLDRIELAPTRAGSYVLAVRVPLDAADSELARKASMQLRDATIALRGAVASGDVATVEGAVSAGVSAEFCEGMQSLAGAGGREQFEIGFRWARRPPAGLAPETVSFPEGSAEIIAAAADRLRRHSPSGEVTITGVIESLNGQSADDGRWHIRVRGSVAGTEGNRRVLWVGLVDRDAYDSAYSAQTEGHRVRARGVLSGTGQRAELIADDFEVLG
jgi:hypothetical protein